MTLSFVWSLKVERRDTSCVWKELNYEPPQLLLSGKKTTLNFTIEANWLDCFGYRLFDLSWEVFFTIWITTWPKPYMEETTRRNPNEALRQRLAEDGINTRFFGDEFVQSLLMHVPTVNLLDLMRSMKAITVAAAEEYSTPIVLLD
jgi:hypothetical protein